MPTLGMCHGRHGNANVVIALRAPGSDPPVAGVVAGRFDRETVPWLLRAISRR
ncbi:MAG TPA: hypothetical protein VGW38_17035 [Chloroflexota bacterium]|nr:hypothetical protein [Chloroflexota bacterium]